MSVNSPNFQSLRSASEFLTQIRPYPPSRQLFPFGTKPHPISLKRLETLLTQSVYLIFYLSAMSPGYRYCLSKRLWVGGSGEEEEGLSFILATPEGEEEGLQQFIQEECMEAGGEAVPAMRGCVEACLQCYKECRTKGYILPLRLNEAIIKMEMEEFCYVYFSVLTPKFNTPLLTPASLLRALEETRLFRENALLLKYSNHSLLTKALSLEKCRMDLHSLMEAFQAQRKLFLKEPVARVSYSQDLMEKFLIALSLCKFISLNVSLTEETGPESKAQEPNTNKIRKVVGEQTPQSRAVVLSFNVEEVPYQFLTPQRLDYLLSHPEAERIPEEKPNANRRINEFQLKYFAVGNQLEVKLFTGHFVRPQELDLTAVVLASLSLPDVEYSFQEPRKAKNNEKCVTLRSRAHLHPKEVPFAVLLETVDGLIAQSLVIEHDLRARKEVGERRRTEIIETGQYLLEHVRHLSGIFWEETAPL